jgi:iron complex transport system substrate-binding protein
MRKALIAVLAFVALGSAQVLVVDQAGREVLIPSQPQRIASAFGVATPYLYAFVPPEAIVAARYLGLPDHPLSRAVMARIDPNYAGKALGAEITAEELVARNVDLVFAGLKHLDLARVLSEVGIPSVLIGPETFEAVKDATLLIGRALGQEERAQVLVKFYEDILSRIAQATSSLPPEKRPKVLVLGPRPCGWQAVRCTSRGWWSSPEASPSPAGLPGSWQNVNIEQVLIWNPDVILIVPYSPVEPAQILSDPLWAAVEAVKTGRVYKMPQLLFAWDTPIPESVLGILWMAELFHPGEIELDFR